MRLAHLLNEKFRCDRCDFKNKWDSHPVRFLGILDPANAGMLVLWPSELWRTQIPGNVERYFEGYGNEDSVYTFYEKDDMSPEAKRPTNWKNRHFGIPHGEMGEAY